jgi:hypothetical protein
LCAREPLPGRGDVSSEVTLASTKQKEEKRKKPKPEEQEGMPPRQHSLLKSVAEIGTQNAMKRIAHPPKNAGKEQK